MDSMPKACACVVVAAVALTLQGCEEVPRLGGYFSVSEVTIGTHEVANWRAATNYFEAYSFKDPFNGLAGFNSCMNPHLDTMHVCSGRGSCKAFDADDVANPVFFCECEEGYGDPECGTLRKRQSTAWLISLLVGFTGADELYLQWWFRASVKLVISIFALLVWVIFGASKFGGSVFFASWMFDIVRIGSAPVRAASFRVEGDLPAFNFAVLTVVFFAFVGFVAGTRTLYYTILVRKYRAGRDLTYGSTSSHFLAKEVPHVF
mmetsp:Transcript_53868/g.128289  ORF Transcript_53868/g.128289 Transcript_53868/m.128289 type:complete len:262 (-) Transcript_53868:48-833(-)